MESIRAAAVQMRSTRDVDRNLGVAETLVRRAASEGARFVALPENFALMAAEGVVLERTEPLDGPLVGWGRQLARELGVDLLLGSVPETASRPGMRRNTSVLVDREGEVRAVYRKIHLFDVDLGDVSLRESSVVEPGREVVVGELAWGRVGLSVCYDLRFPELYRVLRFAGAEVLAVPAAFTATTGPHHWHLLLRARAVENQAFVVAPAQVGRHGRTRASYGHAAIVDPWGEVLADAGTDEQAVAIADLDVARLDGARRRIPCLDHARRWLLAGRTRDETE
ncbi:MAG: carbon-nitrogen hydrolase family protein [Acidobacteriota bacterium]|nr:MAG: carbon-nitrogen hydrolase family protein [Acidobacteriota bacterium]